MTAARGQRCAPGCQVKEAQSCCHLAPSSSKQKSDWPSFILTGRKLILVSSGKGGRPHHFAFWKTSWLKSSRRRLSQAPRGNEDEKVAWGGRRKPVDSRGKEREGEWERGGGEKQEKLLPVLENSSRRSRSSDPAALQYPLDMARLSDFYPPSKLKATYRVATAGTFISASWFIRLFIQSSEKDLFINKL